MARRTKVVLWIDGDLEPADLHEVVGNLPAEQGWCGLVHPLSSEQAETEISRMLDDRPLEAMFITHAAGAAQFGVMRSPTSAQSLIEGDEDDDDAL